MEKPKRIILMDEIRGLCIVLMVFYHALYDIVFVNDLSISFFDKLFSILIYVQPFFAAVFVTISGISSRLSHSNLKRGLQLLVISLFLTIITRVFIPSETIYFGILHMLSLSILIFALTRPLLDKIPPLPGLSVSTLLFLVTYGIQYGYVGIANIKLITLSKNLYDTHYLFAFGIPNKSFISSDYFPLVPWLFLFIAGTFLGVYVKKGKGVPLMAYKTHYQPLYLIGKHTLIIYLIHQPVLYGLFSLIKWVI